MPSSHAALDRASREVKARKIVKLLRRERPLEGLRLLEVGAGSGIITSELARALGPAGEAVGVDVRDQRVTREGYRFELVEGTHLPFADASFDVVVSNLVIEHVGERADQLTHLREIARVLRRDGVVYLAAPNRWSPVEPHFKVPFLSWLPERQRSRYVRLARAGTHYDCRPPSRPDLLELARSAGLAPREITWDALAVMADDEPSLATRVAAALPVTVLRPLGAVVPTMVFILQRLDLAPPRG
jgi:SAM-dependent methyltransferase